MIEVALPDGSWKRLRRVSVILSKKTRNGDTEIVRLLLEHGGDANATNPSGHTVLYCAGGHGHLETLELLLANGADCDAKSTDDGKTLMEWLDQYPEDTRFTPIARALRRHKEA